MEDTEAMKDRLKTVIAKANIAMCYCWLNRGRVDVSAQDKEIDGLLKEAEHLILEIEN